MSSPELHCPARACAKAPGVGASAPNHAVEESLFSQDMEAQIAPSAHAAMISGAYAQEIFRKSSFRQELAQQKAYSMAELAAGCPKPARHRMVGDYIVLCLYTVFTWALRQFVHTSWQQCHSMPPGSV